MSQLYIGLMSGTSADGVDAILAEIDQSGSFKLLDCLATPYPDRFRDKLLALALSQQISRTSLGELSYQLGEQFSNACLQLLQRNQLSSADICAIGSHGHTIDHAPDSETPYSIQIGNHSLVAERTGVTTVADFRSRDIAAGGQGAPLVPAFHQWLFQQAPDQSAIINIGGISNITALENVDSKGYDCGPGNCLLDSWHQRHSGESYDKDGVSARQGAVVQSLLKLCLNDPYFQQPAPKSTGREYFNLDWLEAKLEQIDKIDQVNWQDIGRTLLELTAQCILDCARHEQRRQLYLCGGGYHNSLLVERITALASTHHIDVDSTLSLGLDVDWVEASAFAWLARQTVLSLPGNLPSATGAKGPRVLGAIYPA